MPAKPKCVSWKCRCGASISFASKDPDLHLIPERFKCRVPRCRYYYARAGQAQKHVTVVKASVIYKVLMSFGDQKESQCDARQVRQWLVGKKIAALSLESVNPSRTLVFSLTLDDGTTAHFGSSTRGATIYKVTHEQD